ncbi:SGNH/GDSL hydrolase family protein [Myxococcota bacterium]|nr:SGNH/GDSL hydrolase family protein [Myxococcota bacterium]
MAFVCAALVLALAVAEIVLRLRDPGEQPTLARRTVHAPLVRREREVLDRDGKARIARFTTNRLGLRGREPPADFARTLTIVVAGGTTAEEPLLDDEATWPMRLERLLALALGDVWIAGGGISGTSTFGQVALAEGGLFDPAPDYVLYLLGSDEIQRSMPSPRDETVQVPEHSWFSEILRATAVGAKLLAELRGAGVRVPETPVTPPLDLTKVDRTTIDGERIRSAIAEHTLQHAPALEARLELLVDRVRARGVEPIFVTQPALFGDAADPTTGLDLGTMRVERESAAERWQILEVYNAAIRRSAAANGVFLVDLARKMPKDSRLFHDWLRFSRAGAATAAEIIARDLTPWLAKRSETHAPRGARP